MKKETIYGTLTFDVVRDKSGFRGKVQHILHKQKRFNGKVLTRYSKYYKTQRGAEAWIAREWELQNEN